jgi:hypothetical protein
MSDFPHEPPVTPPVNGALSGPNHRDLSPEELAALPLQALLVRTGRLTLDQLSDALRENVSSGRTVEEIAVARGWVSPEDLDNLRQAKAAYTPAVVSPPAPVAPAPPAPVAVAVAPAPAPAPPPPPVAPAPAPPPVAVAPPPAPPVAVAPPPAPPPVAVAPAPTPPPAPPPAPMADPDPASSNGSGSVGVFLNLEDGSRIWVGRFDDAESGQRRAQEIINSLMRPEPGQWARFGNRLIRPESVVGVEVSPRRDD